MDKNDEQILGISGDLSGMHLPTDMNGAEFRTNFIPSGERVPAAEMARLNALVRGEPNEVIQNVRAHGQRGRGRGNRRRGMCRRVMT